MDEFEMRKYIGRSRQNPDSKKTWKKYVWKQPKPQYRRAEKNRFRAADRRNHQSTIEDKQSLKTARKIKQEPYHGEKYCFSMSPLREAQRKRSGRFCALCGELFCRHRARESAILIMHSWACEDGAFANFPKDIALMIANLIYREQIDFLEMFSEFWHDTPRITSGPHFDKGFRKMGVSVRSRRE